METLAWPEFRAAFVAEFQEIEDRGSKIAALLKMRMRADTLRGFQDYVLDFAAAADRIHPDLDDDALHRAFCDGLASAKIAGDIVHAANMDRRVTGGPAPPWTAAKTEASRRYQVREAQQTARAAMGTTGRQQESRTVAVLATPPSQRPQADAARAPAGPKRPRSTNRRNGEPRSKQRKRGTDGNRGLAKNTGARRTHGREEFRGNCFTCGQPGHKANECPEGATGPSSSGGEQRGRQQEGGHGQYY
jgi:hypothetical protein